MSGQVVGRGRRVLAFVYEEVSTVVRDVLVNSLVNGPVVPTVLRAPLLAALGVEVTGSRIASGSFMGGRHLSVGAGTFVNRECFFDGSAPIRIGRRCAIGFRVSIVTGTHLPGGPERRAGANTAAPVVVGDGTWIGAGAMILPGVTIGEGCVIAAGAVVTKDCDAHGVYAGVPARRVRDLEPLSQG